MATLVLTAVGTALGGPLGGALGALVGRQADLAIFGSGSREGPRLKELSVTTSSYGQPIARHFGRMRAAGTVIWATELTETSTKQSSGKGRPSTKTYSYTSSFAVALSSTPLDRIGRIWADGNLLRGATGDLKVGGQMRAYLGIGDNPIDPLIAADQGGDAPAFRDCAYVVFEDLQLADFGNRIPALTFEVFGASNEAISLQELVPQSNPTSPNDLLQSARGFSDEGGSIGSSLAAINRVIPLVCLTTEKGLSLTVESQTYGEIATLPEQLSDRDSEDAAERHTQRGKTFDREPLALRYYDEGRDYQPGVQRALGLRPHGREAIVDLPATMTANGARALANENAQRARWQNETIIWRIGELDPHIVPGSVVKLPDIAGIWKVKAWEWFDRGIELTLERAAPDLDAQIASDPGTAPAPVDVSTPQTILQAIEVPSDGTTDPRNPVLYAATTAEHEGWRGASLFVAQGDVLSEIGTVDHERAVMGTLLHPLESSNTQLFQPVASIEIEVSGDGLSFANTDLTGLAMGLNRLMVGSEVIQFQRAEFLGGRTWRLSGLLRGRAGTEHASINGQSAGVLAVLLDHRLTRLDPSLVPSVEGTRVAAIGFGDDEAVYSGLQNVGISRRPLMPVAPAEALKADGTLTLCWARRARGEWRWEDHMDVALVEEREAYQVGFGPTNTPAAVWTVNEPQFEFTAEIKSDLLAQYGPGTIWVRQEGTFGKSPALKLAEIS